VSTSSLFIRRLFVIAALGFASGIPACQVPSVNIGDQQTGLQEDVSQGQGESDLIIENDSQLPETYPHASYEVRFRAHGGVPPLHWRVEKGALPPGLKLKDDGLLYGSPEHTGEFQFTVSVTDSGQPQRSVQKAFVVRVRSAMVLNWKNPAHVNVNRIDGSAEISNTTADDIDLTFIVLAVPENGRAVAIGYQHFVLRRGTVGQELPFGETLPRGGYVVHVDAVGEVPAKNIIYRERMQTPSMLQVTVGP
jgi:Putative Ig domain